MGIEKLNDIMTRAVIASELSDSLYEAHQLMKEHHIRHLPVVDENMHFKGVVTQRDVLREAFLEAERKGSIHLAEFGQNRQVSEVMSTDVEPVTPETDLVIAGEYFLKVKHGCLPIVEDTKLVGIVTSADFVKLAIEMLKSAQSD